MKRKDNKRCETNMTESDRIIRKKKEDNLFEMLRNNDVRSKSSLNLIWMDYFYHDIKNITNKIASFSNQSSKKEAYKKYMLAFNINVNDACIYFKDILINTFKIYDEIKLDYILYIKKHAQKTNNMLFLKYLYNINVFQEDISICPFSCDNYTNNVVDKFYALYNNNSNYDESKEIKRLYINLEICRKCICNTFKFLGDLFRYKYKFFNEDKKENEFNSYINYYRSLYYSRSNGYLFTQLSLLYTNTNPIKSLYFHFLSLISYRPSKSRDTVVIFMEQILDKKNTAEAILQFVKDVYQFSDESGESSESGEDQTENNSDHTCMNNKKIKRIIKKRSKSISHRRKSRKRSHSYKNRKYNNSSIENDIETCSSIDIHSYSKNVAGTYSSSSGSSCSENGNDTCSRTKPFRSNTNKKSNHDCIDDGKNGKNGKNEHRRNGNSGEELTTKQLLRRICNEKKMDISKKKNKNKKINKKINIKKNGAYKELKETIVKFYISYFKIIKLLFSKIDMNKFEKKKNKFMYYTNKYVKIQYYNKIDNDLIFKNIIVIVFTLLSMIIYIITNQYDIKRNKIDKFFYGNVDINKYIYKNEQIYFSFILIHEILLSCKYFYNNFYPKYLSIFIYIMYWIHNEPSLNNTHITKLDEQDNEEKNNLIKQYHEYYKKKATVDFCSNNNKKDGEKKKYCKNNDQEYLKNGDIIHSIKDLIYSIKIKEDVKFDIRLLYYILDEDSCVHPFLNDLEFQNENIRLSKCQDSRNSQINTYSVQELSDFDNSDEEDVIFLKKKIFGKSSSFSTDKKLKKEKNNKLNKYNELYEDSELYNDYENTENDSCSDYTSIQSKDKKKGKVKQYEESQKINHTNFMINKNKHKKYFTNDKKNDEEIYHMGKIEDKIRIIRFYSILNSKNKIDNKNKISKESKNKILKQTKNEYLKTNIKKNNSKRIKMIKNIRIFSKDVQNKQADNDPLISCIIANKRLKKKSENTDSTSDDMNNQSDSSYISHSNDNELKSESENSKIAMITNSNNSDEDTEDKSLRNSSSINSDTRNSTSGYVSNYTTSEDYEGSDSKSSKTVLNKLCDSKKLKKRHTSLNNKFIVDNKNGKIDSNEENNNTDIIKTYHENIIPKNEETTKREINVCHISVKNNSISNNNEYLYNNRKNILNDICVQKNSNFVDSTKFTKLEYLPFTPTQKDNLYDSLKTSIINNSSNYNEIKKDTYEEILNDVVINYRNKNEGGISLNILNSNLYFNERNKKVVLLDGKNIGTRYQSNYIKYFDIFRIKTVLDYYKLNKYKVKIIIPQEYVIQHSDTLNIRHLIQKKSQKEPIYYTSNGINEKNYHINSNYHSDNHLYKNNGYDINNDIIEDTENNEFYLNTKDLLFFKHLNILGCLITHPLESYYQFCIYLIQKFNSGFVTNITISELASKLHKYEQAIQPIFPHLISYTFLGDEFLPNPDFKWPTSNSMK
ncbi:conserved Plasmodium protein, unknown function [Plasmodium berghei]|uniref:Tetratricopeptide repeat protein, putative n=2 Tax=Plasmodium berghei TaxID=5821 RepID=A0A509AKW1_PLABA|nr:tetratricopeptide repeat protein, putative [Plasmodium berghei ANKA]CXI35203.1 conserved Plasmodium protein, unknown function [Plasmodium berghei]SCM21485.1 conserved Plasmodium protein, unknown function [Plasmodium berghei]SCN24690.1 conserved Plasmodium protein, unknown function [Plasmodium berghei]SCO59837.1 conserved Plasmodium protein, unknown function [Plasmodium berghei]SCO61131.1 conserved Plasmodium protein, unknown function [Plasmodium berghei]|eukprot:XP_034421245.1 tetratricopeptide repeat protein, putative [Plasmodium berghei ANKA]